MNRLTLLVTLILLISVANGFGCTTAIISGRATPDGHPLLYKHRDSDHFQNAIRYFTDGTFNYLGLVNADDTEGKEVWAGVNSAGFAIMNAASYNLKARDDSTELADQEGVLMKLALQKCRTLKDFETLLDTLPKPLGVESNFGVIDAYGGAAYYETDNWGYHKLDVNDPAVAPFGYLIHTNYSFHGRAEDGYGYIRYQTAEQLFQQAVSMHQLNARFILQKVSRSLQHSLTGVNLATDPPDEQQNPQFVCFRDFIPRYSSVSVVLVRGVKAGENPDRTLMWTILGFPLTSVSFPLWPAAGNQVPTMLSASESHFAPLCNAALQLKERCFPIKRGSGKNYLNRTALLNRQGNGILQQVLLLEDRIFQETRREEAILFQKKNRQDEIQRFYQRLSGTIRQFYREKLNLKW